MPKFNLNFEYRLKNIDNFIDRSKKVWSHYDYMFMTDCNSYEIFLGTYKGFTHLRIERLDGKNIESYMVLQQIKNDLLGAKEVAFEVYPREDELRNGTNARHLWSKENLYLPDLNDLH